MSVSLIWMALVLILLLIHLRIFLLILPLFLPLIEVGLASIQCGGLELRSVVQCLEIVRIV